MANKSLFSSLKSYFAPADTRNEAGGPAYALTPKHHLAQLAATGCFNGTYYSTAKHQLDTLRDLIAGVNDDLFLAKLAVYSRDRAFMKDMPAALTAVLAARDPALFHQVFDRVIDNGRMLRTLFQMIRSGQFGKKSLSSGVQRAFQRWLNSASVEQLIAASIGGDPSLRDVMRLARPTPADNARRALFGWLTDREPEKWAPATVADLPEQVRALAAFRAAATAEEQLALFAARDGGGRALTARWDLLGDTAKDARVWTAIARAMGPQALRMNLNTLQRHGVFDDEAVVAEIAARLSSPDEIRRARQFPYQYFAAYMNATSDVPKAITIALHEAAEIACGNVPVLPAPVIIGLDVSGSMKMAVTGNRGHGATSVMRCVDVAALAAAAILRRNPESVVIPFDLATYPLRIDPSDSILSVAERLAKFGGGGTDCSLPLRMANATHTGRKFAGVILISDNESWVYRDRVGAAGASGSTGVVTEWERFAARQRRHRKAGEAAPKLICIDLQPYATTQAPESRDILNIGGFSDAVFSVIASFLEDDASRFVAEVEAVTL